MVIVFVHFLYHCHFYHVVTVSLVRVHVASPEVTAALWTLAQASNAAMAARALTQAAVSQTSRHVCCKLLHLALCQLHAHMHIRVHLRLHVTLRKDNVYRCICTCTCTCTGISVFTTCLCACI